MQEIGIKWVATSSVEVRCQENDSTVERQRWQELVVLDKTICKHFCIRSSCVPVSRYSFYASQLTIGGIFKLPVVHSDIKQRGRGLEHFVLSDSQFGSKMNRYGYRCFGIRKQLQFSVFVSYLDCSKKKVSGSKVHAAWVQGSRARREALVEEVTDTYTHFSTFALSGNNGTIRWHHLAADFKPQQVITHIHNTVFFF